MSNTIQTLYKTQAYGMHYGDMRQKKIWLQNSFYVPDTARIVNRIHNKEVATVLEEVSSVLVLFCMNSIQIELKCGIHKT